jgi:hypothetical protein
LSFRDDVRAARGLVDANRLLVGDDDDREQAAIAIDTGMQLRAAGDGRREENDERGLGRVRHRRERVRGEDRQRQPLRKQRLLELAVDFGRPTTSRLIRGRAVLLECRQRCSSSAFSAVTNATRSLVRRALQIEGARRSREELLDEKHSTRRDAPFPCLQGRRRRETEGELVAHSDPVERRRAGQVAGVRSP